MFPSAMSLALSRGMIEHDDTDDLEFTALSALLSTLSCLLCAVKPVSKTCLTFVSRLTSMSQEIASRGMDEGIA